MYVSYFFTAWPDISVIIIGTEIEHRRPPTPQGLNPTVDSRPQPRRDLSRNFFSRGIPELSRHVGCADGRRGKSRARASKHSARKRKWRVDGRECYSLVHTLQYYTSKPEKEKREFALLTQGCLAERDLG